MKITINLLTVVGGPAAHPAALAAALALPSSTLEVAPIEASSGGDEDDAYVLSNALGSVTQLDGWRVQVDPDRVELRDIHSDLRIVFRRFGAQWVLEPAG